MSTIRVSNVADLGGTVHATMSNLSTTGFYTRQIVTQVDTTFRSAVGWTLGPTFANLSGFQANSLIKLTYFVPARNNDTSWGGMYIEPQVRFNSGTYQSLGSSGYDGGVMTNNGEDIGHYHQTILIDPSLSTAFDTQFRFYFKSYGGTAMWNTDHDINANSGTATIMSGNNGLQHYMHIVVEELARFV